MLRLVVLVKPDVSEDLTRATRRNISEDAILESVSFSNAPGGTKYGIF
jgi:hypothetical protein